MLCTNKLPMTSMLQEDVCLFVEVKWSSPCACCEDIWRSGGITPFILNLALHGCKWSASRLGSFLQRMKAPTTARIQGWVVFRASLNRAALEKRKIFCHCWTEKHNASVVKHTAQSLCVVCYPSHYLLNHYVVADIKQWNLGLCSSQHWLNKVRLIWTSSQF